MYEEGTMGHWKEHWLGSLETWVLVSSLTFTVFVIWQKFISLDLTDVLLTCKTGLVILPACLDLECSMFTA